MLKTNKMKIMNINKLLSMLCLGVGLSISLTGCLKDDDYDNGDIQSVRTSGDLTKPIELKISATDNSDFATVSVNSTPNDTTSDFLPVVLATKDPAPEDIHVTVEMVDSLVDIYNAEQAAVGGTSDYAVPDPSMYTIPTMEIVIPKGSNTGYLQISYHIPDFVGADWAFGFKIVSVKEAGYTISSNFLQGVVSLAVKNQYDGIYKASGTMVHPSFPGTFSNKDETMTTSGANSVDLYPLNTTVLFGVDLNLTVDPSTNLVSVTSSTVVLDPYDPAKNYYDPATKSFYIDVTYSGGTRHVTMVAVYDRPR
jgi:Domain of unknown function (DUF1735)